MISLHLVILVLALIAFVAAAAGVQSRINLTAAGLALWILSVLIP